MRTHARRWGGPARLVGIAALVSCFAARPAFAQQNPFDPSWFPRLPPLSGSVRFQPPPLKPSQVSAGQVLNASFTLPIGAVGAPGDASTACGPRGLLSIGNLNVTYSDKSGSLYFTLERQAFFGQAHTNDAYIDPRVLYDPQSGRFFVMMLEIPLSN